MTMSTIPTCHRCPTVTVPMVTNSRAAVDEETVILVEVSLCRDCRFAAGQENAAAQSRGAGVGP